MSIWKSILFLIPGIVMLVTPGHAEVHLEKDRLTVNVHETSMHQVLDKLAHQGNINVITLEATQVGNVKISKSFWNLPIEEGLGQILSGWNYATSRNGLTRKITRLYIVSRRTDPSTLPSPVAAPTNARSSHTPYPQPTILNEAYDDESPYTNLGYDEFTDEPDFPSEEGFENLPPDLREELEKRYRDESG